MMRLAINQPFDLALSLEMGQAFRWRRVGDEGIANRDWGRPPARWRTDAGAGGVKRRGGTPTRVLADGRGRLVFGRNRPALSRASNAPPQPSGA